jgi:hypothetical protein
MDKNCLKNAKFKAIYARHTYGTENCSSYVHDVKNVVMLGREKAQLETFLKCMCPHVPTTFENGLTPMH